MIEFKQIVGRGTRMFDGKTLPFTTVDAYHLADPGNGTKQNLVMYAESDL
jgi:type I site-specific restriction endonuclease